MLLQLVFFLPNANWVVAIIPPILFGALMFAFMDASFNVTFQPFRSLVADMTPDEQTIKVPPFQLCN
jgi:maltose/moltooligosaccharide transporter